MRACGQGNLLFNSRDMLSEIEIDEVLVEIKKNV